MPGVPGVPDGGVTGGGGLTLVVSRGSCPRAVELTAPSNPSATVTTSKAPAARDAKRAELVVCVSLTNVRTVYFTP